MSTARYRGRFAPSPTGPLHAGSLVAALASWLDARAHGGAWLLRIEDVDTPRCVPGAAETIFAQLARCGLLPDEPPQWQSTRGALYGTALQRLLDERRAIETGDFLVSLPPVLADAPADDGIGGTLRRDCETTPRTPE